MESEGQLSEQTRSAAVPVLSAPVIVERRRNRSLAALRQRFPQVAARLSRALQLDPVLVSDQVVDLWTGECRLYGRDARERSLEQVEAFLRKPGRLLHHPPVRSSEESALKGAMMDFLSDQCRSLEIDPAALSAQPVATDTFLVVLGVGLGHHLRPLIERTDARFVVLVESSGELLLGALAAIDWEALLDDGEAAGKRFDLILEDHADAIVRMLGALFLERGGCFLDGAYVFLHYPAPPLAEARSRINEVAQLVFMSRGFFEDERVMLTHATENIQAPRCHLIGASPVRPRPEAAMIIAAGPSLDRTLPSIRRLAPSMVVFSCGTALLPCLRNGIVPDFHCETENTGSTYRALSYVSEQYDLLKIALVASITINPAAPKLFGKVLFFFRDLTSSTRLIAPDQELFFTSPTGANTAMRTAVALGFTTLYLFGTDCGARVGGRKHAENTIYRLDNASFKEFYDHESSLAFTIEHPGNFGGTVLSDNTLNWCRIMIEGAIAAHGLTVFNCSDGALIKGAEPLRPETLTLPDPPLERASGNAEICSAWPFGHRDTLINDQKLRDSVLDSERFFDAFDEALETIEQDCTSLVEVWQAIGPLLDERRALSPGASMVFGTATTLLTLGAYYIHRTPDDGLRQALLRRFLAEYRRVFAVLRPEAMDLITRCATTLSGTIGTLP